MTFGEHSTLTSPTEALRLRPLAEVNDHIASLRARFVVLKPLVESQNAPLLLDHLRNAVAIWMYRRFDNVAASDLRYFGMDNGLRNLHLLLSNTPPNWRGECVPVETRTLLNSLYTHDISSYDAAALFWWARNALYFQLQLDRRPDVFLCSYETLVKNSDSMMRSLYRFLGIEFPGRRTTKHVHTKALNHQKLEAISPEVRSACQDLYDKLQRSSGSLETAPR
jgi:hypothetical protein